MLRRYRLTIDYAGHASYWLRTDGPDQDAPSQVGVTLVYRSGHYRVGRIVRRDGRPTVEGLAPGDEILRIDEQAVQGWPRDRILAALHGGPGDHHTLTIERDGHTSEVLAPVTSF
ncbi:MAG: PDZ domain-containing protein [Janthinobacterium lividum]